MLEGLEISEVFLSELERTQRIDSDFYKSENLKLIDQLTGHNSKSLTEFASVSDGNHLSISDYFTNDGVPYYRGGDIYNFYIEQTSDPLKIPLEIFNTGNMKRSHLKKGDVLISIVGAIIGNLSLVKTDSKATCSCKLAILRPNKIKPELLAIFLKSKYGQNQIQKFRRGTGQTGFILEDFDQLLIPNFSEDLSNNIKQLIDKSYAQLELSQHKYSQAENLLLETLGFQNFEPSKEPVNIKNFKESFLASGRLDAEYYQIKYEQVVAKLKTQNYSRFGDIVKIKKSIEPGSDAYSEEGLPFLRVADYNKFGISKPQKCLSDSYCKENSKKLSELKLKKDSILFSKDGSVGNAFVVKENMNMVSSGAVLHLSIKNEEQVLPEYLALVLNSQLVQMQAERDAGGSIILHWRVSEIENAIVPIIDLKKQQQISALIEESFCLKKQSEQLLELAKTAVEKAIEENEQAVLAFINLEMKKMNIIVR